MLVYGGGGGEWGGLRLFFEPTPNDEQSLIFCTYYSEQTMRMVYRSFLDCKGERLPVGVQELSGDLVQLIQRESQRHQAVLLIPDVYPNFLHPRSRVPGQKYSRSRIRIRIKEFRYF
jgi:hypothetical protein